MHGLLLFTMGLPWLTIVNCSIYSRTFSTSFTMSCVRIFIGQFIFASEHKLTFNARGETFASRGTFLTKSAAHTKLSAQQAGTRGC